MMRATTRLGVFFPLTTSIARPLTRSPIHSLTHPLPQHKKICLKQNKQVSWYVPHRIAASGSETVKIFDEETFSRAQKVRSLFTHTHTHVHIHTLETRFSALACSTTLIGSCLCAFACVCMCSFAHRQCAREQARAAWRTFPSPAPFL